MKQKDEYPTADLPEPFLTTIDLEDALGIQDEDAFKLLKFLKAIGAGEIYTEIDDEKNRVLYSRGLHWINRTGVYAFVFNKK